MVSISELSRGKVVYGNGSLAPNRGAVSAAGAKGYLQRELSKPKPVISNSINKAGKQGKPVFEQKKPKKKKPKKPVTVGTPVTTPSTVSPPPAPAPVAVPQVTVNDDGTLSLPFNQQFSQATLDALQEYYDTMLGVQTEEQNQSIAYGQSIRDAELAYGNQKRASLNSAAARGVASSSPYAVAVGRDATDYGNTINDIESTNTAFKNYATQAKTNAVNYLRNSLNAAAAENAAAQQANASNVASAPNANTIPKQETKKPAKKNKKTKTKKKKK